MNLKESYILIPLYVVSESRYRLREIPVTDSTARPGEPPAYSVFLKRPNGGFHCAAPMSGNDLPQVFLY